MAHAFKALNLYGLWSSIYLGMHSQWRIWDGGALPARAFPTDQNFFKFMGFFIKCINILGQRPPQRSWRPLLRQVLDPPLIADIIWKLISQSDPISLLQSILSIIISKCPKKGWFSKAVQGELRIVFTLKRNNNSYRNFYSLMKIHLHVSTLK